MSDSYIVGDEEYGVRGGDNASYSILANDDDTGYGETGVYTMQPDTWIEAAEYGAECAREDYSRSTYFGSRA